MEFVNVLSLDDKTVGQLFDPKALQEIDFLNSSVHVVKGCRYCPPSFEFAVKYIPIRQDRSGTDDEANKKKLENLFKGLQGFKKLINHENIVKFMELTLMKKKCLYVWN
jgi:hypothetical protein